MTIAPCAGIDCGNVVLAMKDPASDKAPAKTGERWRKPLAWNDKAAGIAWHPEPKS